MAWSEAEQIQCMGETEAQLLAGFDNCLGDGVTYIAGFLSDAQELLERSIECSPQDRRQRLEMARQLLNGAKFLMFEKLKGPALARFGVLTPAADAAPHVCGTCGEEVSGAADQAAATEACCGSDDFPEPGDIRETGR